MAYDGFVLRATTAKEIVSRKVHHATQCYQYEHVLSDNMESSKATRPPSCVTEERICANDNLGKTWPEACFYIGMKAYIWLLLRVYEHLSIEVLLRLRCLGTMCFLYDV